MQVVRVSSLRTEPFWNSIIEKKLRELKKRWDIVTDGACLTMFDHSFKFHSFNKFSRLPMELTPFQLETQLLKEQPVKPCSQENIFRLHTDRKYFKFMYNYKYSGKQSHGRSDDQRKMAKRLHLY